MIFLETSVFTRQIENLLTDDEYIEIQNLLIKSPTAAPKIKGSGGIRKLKWKLQPHGKRGGVRILYFYHVQYEQILLLTIFSKHDKEDLTIEQLNKLKKLVDNEFQ
jgi:hypothetical protein